MQIKLLGTAQDGGVPHLGCVCENCSNALNQDDLRRRVASIAILDDDFNLLVDATPDIIMQLHSLKNVSRRESNLPIDGVLITHLHVGHYVGLLQFGKEAASTSKLPVYVTPAVAKYLSSNKPFSYLIDRKEIELVEIKLDLPINFGNFSITAFHVPHRNEDGDTLAIEVKELHTSRTLIYVPDLDSISDELLKRINNVDIIIFDGTFYSRNEIGRQKEVPHPPIEDVITRLGMVSDSSFYFTHFNHSNPVLNENSIEYENVTGLGYQLAKDNQTIFL